MTKLFFEKDGNLVSLFLDSPDQAVNSVAGEIIVPAKMTVRQIQDANSLINFWVDTPAVKEDKIIFAGIIPGGYQDTGGKILSFLLATDSKSDFGLIELGKIRVLLNDGLGTETAVETSSIIFQPTDNVLASLEDDIPPEEFAPLISSDPAIFNGAKFLVFQTQDKQSGISHYEVSEGDYGSGEHWQRAASPYLIINQKLDERIEVKAVDLSGNERIVTAFSPSGDYLDYIFLSIIIIVFLTLCFFVSKKFFHRS